MTSHADDAEMNNVDDSTITNDADSTSVVHALDALPYLDVEYSHDPNMQDQVKQLLQEEMSTLTRTPDDYLADFLQRRNYREQYQSYETPLLASAFDALASTGNPLPSQLDMSRYKLNPPTGDAAAQDHATWIESIQNAQAQLEHQANRAMNLELLKKFGITAWKVHNEQLTNIKNNLSASLDRIKSDVDQLNRKRKASQVAAGNDFAALENGYYSLIWKNHEIELACQQLKERMQKQQKTQ